jgi:hypothetical protein
MVWTNLGRSLYPASSEGPIGLIHATHTALFLLFPGESHHLPPIHRIIVLTKTEMDSLTLIEELKQVERPDFHQPDLVSSPNYHQTRSVFFSTYIVCQSQK